MKERISVTCRLLKACPAFTPSGGLKFVIRAIQSKQLTLLRLFCIINHLMPK